MVLRLLGACGYWRAAVAAQDFAGIERDGDECSLSRTRFVAGVD